MIVPWLVIAAACGAPALDGSVPRPDPIDTAAPFEAGAAKVDITPPPGVPMGGHSLSGKIARGFWSRLYARAIFMRGSGSRLVLLSADLWAFPRGLGDRVVEVLAERGEGPKLGREHIVFAATHTHQSPGGFATSKFYNQMAARHPGFDERLFEFLADRIASAIDAARAARRPATLSAGRAALSGMLVNRSLEAYLLNPEAAALIETAPPEEPPQIGFDVHPDAFLAVDPALTVWRIAADSGSTLALAAFVGVHNTAMGHATELYTADFLGVAAAQAERELAATAGGKPVVALFNGPEGDVSPAWRWQDSRDALRLGTRLANDILRLSVDADPVDVSGGFRFGYEVVEIAGGCSSRDPSICAADHPMMGVATAGGAEDGRSGFWELGWKEGITGPPRGDGHGRKQPAADPPFVPLDLPFGLTPTRLFFPLGDEDVPRVAPIGVYTLGDIALATLPGEFTTALGRRIAGGVSEAVGVGLERTVVVGLANEYLSYFTTPQEYDAQHYEGSSTIYGRWAGRIVLDAVVGIANRLGGYIGERPRRFEYRPGARREFGVVALGDRAVANRGHFDSIAVDPADGTVLEGLPTACWVDGIPTLPPASSDGGFVDEIVVTPRVRVQRSGPDGWSDVDGADDAGLQLLVYVVEVDARSSTWCASWMPPEDSQPVDGNQYRMKVRTTLMDSVFCSPAIGRESRFAHLTPCR